MTHLTVGLTAREAVLVHIASLAWERLGGALQGADNRAFHCRESPVNSWVLIKSISSAKNVVFPDPDLIFLIGCEWKTENLKKPIGMTIVLYVHPHDEITWWVWFEFYILWLLGGAWKVLSPQISLPMACSRSIIPSVGGISESEGGSADRGLPKRSHSEVPLGLRWS